MLLWNSNRALSMGHSIRRSVRGWCWAVIHSWAWIIVWPRISCYGAALWRRIWVPPVKGGVCIGIFGYFGWAERRRSDPSTTAAAADTPTPVGSLVMRLTGSCCRILLPICFGFLQSSGSLPQGFKGKLWFKLVVFYTFDHCFDGIQLHSARLFLQDGPQLRSQKRVQKFIWKNIYKVELHIQMLPYCCCHSLIWLKHSSLSSSNRTWEGK